jgi:hypothetical protein
LRVSRIYSWFADDFGDTPQGLLAHLRTYASASLAPRLSTVTAIAGHDYDWSLNDAVSR